MPTWEGKYPGHQGHDPDFGEEDAPQQEAGQAGPDAGEPAEAPAPEQPPTQEATPTAPPARPLRRAWEFVRGKPQETREPTTPQLSPQERRDQEEANRVRQQLGIAEQEVLKAKAQEAAKETVAKERRGLPIWKKRYPAYFDERQRRDQFLREYELRNQLRERAQKGEATAAEQKQLEQLEENLKAGEGVELTDEERRFYTDFQKALGTRRGRLEADEQQLKDRLEAGKLIEYMRAHPNQKAALITAAIAGVAVATLPLFGVFGAAAGAIKGAIAGAAGGGLAKEARVHSPLEWARDLKISVYDEKLKTERFKTPEELQQMSTQELSAAVGVLKNAIEERKVTGSRGEFLRMWMLYRQANDALLEKSQYIPEKPTAEEFKKEGQFIQMMERVKAKAKSTQEYDRMLRNALSEQERETYISMQKGKGKREWAAAALGASLGASIGGLLGAYLQYSRAEGVISDQMQGAVDEYHRMFEQQVLEQQGRAAGMVASPEFNPLGMSADVVKEFAGKVGGQSWQELARFADNYNIDMWKTQVEGVNFGEWLNGHADWFKSLSPDFQREVLSHPDLAPTLLAKGTATTVKTIAGAVGVGSVLLLGVGGALVFPGLYRAGEQEIRHGLGESKKRYEKGGTAFMKERIAKTEEEAYTEKAEREAKQKKKETKEAEKTKAEQEKKQQEEAEAKQDKEKLEQLVKRVEPGQRYKIEKYEWEVERVFEHPITEEPAVQLIRVNKERKTFREIYGIRRLTRGDVRLTEVPVRRTERERPKAATKEHKPLSKEEIDDTVKKFGDLKGKGDRQKAYDLLDHMKDIGVFEETKEGGKRRNKATKSEYEPILKEAIVALGRTK